MDPTGLIPWYLLGGRVCNYSNRCAVTWYDNSFWGGSRGTYKILRPGEYTPWWADADYVYFDGQWYKCQNLTRCGLFGNGSYVNTGKIGVVFFPVYPEGGYYIPTRDPRFPDNKIPTSVCEKYCKCNESDKNVCNDCQKFCEQS